MEINGMAGAWLALWRKKGNEKNCGGAKDRKYTPLESCPFGTLLQRIWDVPTFDSKKNSITIKTIGQCVRVERAVMQKSELDVFRFVVMIDAEQTLMPAHSPPCCCLLQAAYASRAIHWDLGLGLQNGKLS